MIQVYSPWNQDYENNGNAVLGPEVCELEMNLCGAWELTLENPLDDNSGLIVENAIIKCDTPIGEGQMFRVYDREKDDVGVTAKARPVFFDAARDALLIDVRPTEKTGQQALDIMTRGTRYTAESNIDSIATAYYIRKNLIEAISGSDENSFINRWGGEPVYDNYHLIMNHQCGGDFGARAEFGFNMESIKESVNMEEVVTRIIPESYNGYTLEGDTPWIDSPNIEKYPIIYTKVVQYSDVKLKADCSGDDIEEGFETIEEVRAELKRRARKDFEEGADVPKISYQVEIVDLESTMEYEDIKDLIRIGLGDTVRCYNRRLDINTRGRATRIVYDCILKRNKKIDIGDIKKDYFDKMTSVLQRADNAINQNGTVKGEYVAGLIDAMTARVRASAKDAKKQADKAILFEDLDGSSPTFGAMAVGTTGFMIAGERTEDGKDWKWSTFGTGRGFFADYIVAGTMLADRIRGGLLELGGYNNKDGILRMRGANGDKIGEWNNIGVYSTGHYISDNKEDKTMVDIYNGEIEFSDYRGNKAVMRVFPWGADSAQLQIVPGNQEESVTRYLSVTPDEIRSQNKDITLLAEREIVLMAPKVSVGDGRRAYATLNGRAEFSDGTYLEFVNGSVVGGNAKETGAF